MCSLTINRLCSSFTFILIKPPTDTCDTVRASSLAYCSVNSLSSPTLSLLFFSFSMPGPNHSVMTNIHDGTVHGATGVCTPRHPVHGPKHLQRQLGQGRHGNAASTAAIVCATTHLVITALLLCPVVLQSTAPLFVGAASILQASVLRPAIPPSALMRAAPRATRSARSLTSFLSHETTISKKT